MAQGAQGFRVSGFAKVAFKVQMFLLRNNMMGPAGDMIMIITVKGRKTGNTYSTPIGFVRDGEVLYALNNGGWSNWYKNIQKNPDVTLEIRGKKVQAHAEPINDEAERRKIFELYKQQRGAQFPRFFGVPVDAPAADLDRALASRVFVRFNVAK